MTNPRYDKYIFKAIAVLVILVVLWLLRDIQVKAFEKNINGTLMTAIVGIFGLGIGSVVTIVLGKRKSK